MVKWQKNCTWKRMAAHKNSETREKRADPEREAREKPVKG
jgi:hypothetical protein